MKITEIEINDFRSFLGLNTISLDKKGKNLFLYGENGSGKSSFCRALNLFFDATDKRRLKHLTNINFGNSPFEKGTNNTNGFIKMNFPNTNFTLDKNGFKQPNAETELSDIRRTKGFLEYKNLLPIYLYSNKEKNNLFRLFIEGPYSTLRNPRTNKLISTEWNNRKTNKPTTDFYKGVFEISNQLVNSINRILEYFDPSLNIAFKSRKTWTTGVLYLEVFINGEKLKNYGDFFNEAKLVALSISIYLAIILRQGEGNSNDKVKLLILDDIFIGMDLGNRLPLLKIVSEVFSEYQVFITTFDENWYNMAEFYLEKSNWKFIKAYSDISNPIIPKSILIDSEKEDYLFKANFYYKRFDYPACANYQRKYFERKLKNILPFNLLYSKQPDGSIKENDKLNTNFENFIDYLKSSKLDITPFADFKLYTRIVLNPLSHDNSSSPIYKKEVEEVFNLISEIEKIEVKTLKQVKDNEVSILKLSIQDNNNVWFQYKLQLVDNLRRIKQGENIGFPPCRVITIASKEGNSEWTEINNDKINSLEKKYNELCEKHNSEVGDYTKEYKNKRNVAIYDI